MIAVDTSALMAIVGNEPAGHACSIALANNPDRMISAGTLSEVLIVAARRGLGFEMTALIEKLSPDIIPVTAASARRIAAAYDLWGKGVHHASLNYGDCFAYEVAKAHNCPLLFIGNDFAQTDVVSAL